MELASHYKALSGMYLSSPINTFFEPSIEVYNEACTVEVVAKQTFYHAMGGVHGSVYFKLLDDAAFFAANSVETEYSLLTASFTTYMTKPITEGLLVSKGHLIKKMGRQILAEAVLLNDGEEVGRGSGLFVKSKLALNKVPGYLANV
jgi:acyl-coenzyme A thioesterase PaaI-like protein